MNTYDIAHICHEANRAYCIAHHDDSQKHWESCEQWQRDSAIKGVRFAIDNPNVTPKEQHNAWMRDKLADGWVYGPMKDPTNKTHPCIVEYEQLPLFQQGKDALFIAIVRAMTQH